MSKKVSENTALSESEVFKVLEFAQNYYGMQNSGVFNPYLTNQNMQNMTMNPREPTKSGDIEQALANPKGSEQNLIGFSEYLELSDMIYSRLIYYMGNMLSFNYDFVCTTLESESDYNSAAYKKDYKKLVAFFDKFDVKDEFKRITRQLVRNEAFFGFLRKDDPEKYTIQELPQQFCMITGRFPYGLLYDFNMSFFLNAGISIDSFDPIFKTYYRKAFYDGNGSLRYNPAAAIGERSDAWTFWVQIDPTVGGVVFKLRPEIASRVPLFSPLMPDIALKPLIRKLQTNSYIQSSSKVLFGSVPLLKGDTKGATVKDSMAISAKNLGEFLNLLRRGISDTISIGAAPLEDVQGVSFPLESHSMLGEYSENTAGMSGVNAKLIFGGSQKNNIEDSRNSLSVDEYLMSIVYPAFESFLNFTINREMSKHRFKIMLRGSEFDTYKRRAFSDALALADKGILLPGYISSAIGTNKIDLERMLDEAKYGKFNEKLLPILSVFNTKGGANGVAGRPQKEDDGNLSEEGSNTRESGANLTRGGKV